jgi:hypothetical protein
LDELEVAMKRWLWICPILSVLLSVTVLLYFGWSWKTGITIILVMTCPAMMINGALQIRKNNCEKVIAKPKN